MLFTLFNPTDSLIFICTFSNVNGQIIDKKTRLLLVLKNICLEQKRIDQHNHKRQCFNIK